MTNKLVEKQCVCGHFEFEHGLDVHGKRVGCCWCYCTAYKKIMVGMEDKNG